MTSSVHVRIKTVHSQTCAADRMEQAALMAKRPHPSQLGQPALEAPVGPWRPRTDLHSHPRAARSETCGVFDRMCRHPLLQIGDGVAMFFGMVILDRAATHH